MRPSVNFKETSLFGWKVGGRVEEGYPGQSINLSSSDKYRMSCEICALLIIRSLSLFIFVNAFPLMLTCSFGSGRSSFIPSMLLVP